MAKLGLKTKALLLLLGLTAVRKASSFSPSSNAPLQDARYFSRINTRKTSRSLPQVFAASDFLSENVNTLSQFIQTKSSSSLSSFGDIDLTTAGLLAALPLLFLLLSSSRPPARLLSPDSLDSVVEGTFLGRGESSNLKCVYKASRDGWSALDFHEAVDGKGSAVVVARSSAGKVFGGYNPSGWRSTDDYYTSTAAFLWCFKRSSIGSGGGGNNNNNIVKIPVLAGGNAALYDWATGGPCFGTDLQIGEPKAAVLGGFAGPDMEDMSLNAGNLRQGKGTLGGSYGWAEEWPAWGSFRLIDLEVYCKE